MNFWRPVQPSQGQQPASSQQPAAAVSVSSKSYEHATSEPSFLCVPETPLRSLSYRQHCGLSSLLDRFLNCCAPKGLGALPYRIHTYHTYLHLQHSRPTDSCEKGKARHCLRPTPAESLIISISLRPPKTPTKTDFIQPRHTRYLPWTYPATKGPRIVRARFATRQFLCSLRHHRHI